MNENTKIKDFGQYSPTRTTNKLSNKGQKMLVTTLLALNFISSLVVFGEHFPQPNAHFIALLCTRRRAEVKTTAHFPTHFQIHIRPMTRLRKNLHN
ncbi:Inositol-pentakisphosphate 2-kinase [Trichinella spiralis]|uniref:Inositol-pentakisphosphate 2-kinase n=1 Tax=Trichinella spiralis TaxID=6334 RepID=A0ABR3L0L1_TRISP